MALTAWGDRWVGPEEGPPIRFRHSCAKIVEPTVMCPQCREPFTLTTVTPLPGPGHKSARRDEPRRRDRMDSASPGQPPRRMINDYVLAAPRVARPAETWPRPVNHRWRSHRCAQRERSGDSVLGRCTRRGARRSVAAIGTATSRCSWFQKSIRMTARRNVGRMTSVKPAAAKVLTVPTWSSSSMTSVLVIG